MDDCEDVITPPLCSCTSSRTRLPSTTGGLWNFTLSIDDTRGFFFQNDEYLMLLVMPIALDEDIVA